MQNTRLALTMIHSQYQPTFIITSYLDRFKQIITLPNNDHFAKIIKTWILFKLNNIPEIEIVTVEKIMTITIYDNVMNPSDKVNVLEEVVNTLIIENYIFQPTSFCITPKNCRGNALNSSL